MKLLCGATLAVLLVCAPAAQASIIPISVSVTCDGSVRVFDQVEGRFFSDGSFTGQGSFSDTNYNYTWNVDGKQDPWINLLLNFTNLSSSPVDITITVSMLTVPTGPPSLAGGSVESTLTDGGHDGVELSNNGNDPLYSALVNGGSFRTLSDSPFSYTSSFAPLTYGWPGITDPGPGSAVSSMSLALQFRLTGGGDQAMTFATFDIEPSDQSIVPEPGTICLVTMGLAGLAGRHLRRRGRAQGLG